MSQSGFLSDLSNLGPFFFTVVINDFPKNLNVGCELYVDYTSLYASQNDLIKLQATMEEVQADAVNWLPSNKLHCNQSKTQNDWPKIITYNLLSYWRLLFIQHCLELTMWIL